MSTRSTPAKRRKQLFASAGKMKPSAPLFDRVPEGSPVDNPSPWDLVARVALDLDRSFPRAFPGEPPKYLLKLDAAFIAAIREAFAFFKLDPVDPTSWRVLISCFAWVHFGKPPRKPGSGRHAEWTQQRDLQLDKVMDAALKKLRQQYGDKRVPDTAIAKLVARDRRFQGKGIEESSGVAGLTKRIGQRRRRQAMH